MTNTCKSLLLALVVASSLAYVGAITGCAGDSTSRSTGAYLDDKTISAKVKTDLYSDSQVKASQVDVTTYQGKVQLSGFVQTQAQKDRAAEIASKVKGVQTVQNDLQIRSNIPSTAATTNQIHEPAGTSTP